MLRMKNNLFKDIVLTTLVRDKLLLTIDEIDLKKKKFLEYYRQLNENLQIST